MKTRRIALGVALVLLVANAAFAENVKSDYNKSANLAAYKTFMWIKEPKITDPLMRERVVRDINAALAARGLQLVTSEADMYIAAHTATKEERTLNAFYDGFGADWRWSGGFGSATTTTTTYEIGTLVVDIFDGNTREAIWRGTADKTLSGNAQKNSDHLSKDVAKMFRNFPPAKKAEGGTVWNLLGFLARGVAEAGRR